MRCEFIPVLNLYLRSALRMGILRVNPMAVRARRSTALAARSHHPTVKTRIYRAATSPAAKIAYVTIGTVGLATLAVAIVGPRRFQREFVRPVRDAVPVERKLEVAQGAFVDLRRKFLVRQQNRLRQNHRRTAWTE